MEDTEIRPGTFSSYRSRYGRLFEEMTREIDEFAQKRTLRGARTLSERSGQHFNDNEPPLYFTGDLDSPIVLVHLNPKAARVNRAPAFEGPLPFSTVEEYVTVNGSFGALTYGPTASRTHRSPFDHKQIRFLRPFGVIDFIDEQSAEDRFRNLELVCDRKLQLELIPYPSPTFVTRGLTPDLLQPHFDRIMGVIAARPRRFVIFCGNVFGPLLREWIVREHRFQLTRADGQPERMTSRFANVRLEYEGKTFDAGLAYSFARQGIPMSEYGTAVRRLYGDGRGHKVND